MPRSATTTSTSTGDGIRSDTTETGLTILRHRADFLRAARGRRQHVPGLVLQAIARSPADGTGIRVGYTCSKKVGNAVARNRAKRRLRAVAGMELPLHGRSGWDYVLIGRAGITADRPFAALREDLRTALARIHGPS